jgi:hypothetical protein
VLKLPASLLLLLLLRPSGGWRGAGACVRSTAEVVVHSLFAVITSAKGNKKENTFIYYFLKSRQTVDSENQTVSVAVEPRGQVTLVLNTLAEGLAVLKPENVQVVRL